MALNCKYVHGKYQEIVVFWNTTKKEFSWIIDGLGFHNRIYSNRAILSCRPLWPEFTICFQQFNEGKKEFQFWVFWPTDSKKTSATNYNWLLYYRRGRGYPKNESRHTTVVCILVCMKCFPRFWRNRP